MYSPLQACEALGCRIDYLATHDYRGEADKVMQRLELLHQRYGRKIWLTEFAVCCTRDENVVLDFVKVIMDRTGCLFSPRTEHDRRSCPD